MKENKTCCRIFPIILILLSTFLTLAIWYTDEGFYSFSFLTDKNEIFNFIGSLLFISILPIGLFYYLGEKERFQQKAKPLSLLGFLPALFVLGFILF